MSDGINLSGSCSSDECGEDAELSEDTASDVYNLGPRVFEVDWEQWFECVDINEQREGSTTLEEVTQRLGSSITLARTDTTFDDFRLTLNRVDLDFLQRHGTVRVDVDSMKGLVHFGALVDAFLPGTEAGRRTTPSASSDTHFSVSCTITKDDNHLLGTGWTRLSRPRRVGQISIPKLPSVRRHGYAREFDSDSTWPFPDPAWDSVLEWKSLATLPHFLFGIARGPRGTDLELWCVLPGCEATGTSLVRGKEIFQAMLHKTKEIVIRELDMLIELISSRGNGAGLRRRQIASLGESSKVVYFAVFRWIQVGQPILQFFQSVKTSIVGWSLHSIVPTHSKKGERHTLSAPALDSICQCFDVAVRMEVHNLGLEQASCVMDSLVYIDGKGLKEMLNITGKVSELPNLVAEAGVLAEGLVPSLRAATKGLCRVDIGYEWMVHGDDPRVAMLWSIQNHLPLIGAMPSQWRRATRIYSCLGMSQAVDMQAHNLHWIPPSRDFEGIVPAVCPRAIPSGQGPKFMDIVVPGRVIESRLVVCPEDVQGLFDDVSVVNIYCPGPRKLSTSYGKHWGLDFEGVAQILSILAHVGDGQGVRNVLAKHVEKAGGTIEGFQNHISRELPAQRTWTLRAEVGASTVASAVRLLNWYAAKNGLRQDEQPSAVLSPNDRYRHRRPLCLSVETAADFLVSYVGIFWKVVLEKCARQPVSSRDAIVAGWSEQAIRCVHFLVRGQNPWGYSVGKMFLSGGFLECGILLPSMLENAAGEISEREGDNFLMQVYNPRNPMFSSALGKHRVQGLSRLIQRSTQIRPVLEKLSRRRDLNVEGVYLQAATLILECFYEDAWHYMVSKGHWLRSARVPKFLTSIQDCEFNIAGRHSQLRDPGFNARVTKGSVVFTDQGLGRRGVYSKEYVSRWFPTNGRQASSKLDGSAGQNMRFYSTMVLWDVVCSTLAKEHVHGIVGSLERILADARLVDSGRTVPENRGRASSMLVPDGTGPTRPFNTLNHWVSVVGRVPPAFQASANPPKEKLEVVQVDRKILDREYDLFKRFAKRGFTEHELNVFSMFVLLEGGSDRLNDIDRASKVKVKLDHIGAFRDPVKSVLYCFRLRRSVLQVTDKYKQACLARCTAEGQWSLHDMVRRIRRCLGTGTFGVDGRLNQERAREWLIENKHATLTAYRSGFHGERGPVVDQSNRAAWEAHFSTAFNYPVSTELLPLGYETSGREQCGRDGFDVGFTPSRPAHGVQDDSNFGQGHGQDGDTGANSGGEGAGDESELLARRMYDDSFADRMQSVNTGPDDGPGPGGQRETSRSTFYGWFSESG